MEKERCYSTETLPIDEDLDRYAPPYFPEKYTPEEERFLKPFFSNTDRPVFVIKNLPEEVIAALSSRNSRTTKSLRRVFLEEYVESTLYPEHSKKWGELSNEEKREKKKLAESFKGYIEYLEKTGGIENVANVQRGRKFFEKWLAEFGDDSIAEMGGCHLCIEGLSNVAVKIVEDSRIGISPLEKSSRYVSFSKKNPDGSWQYVVPGEIIGTKYEIPYRRTADSLFAEYAYLEENYLPYIKEKYPRQPGEDKRAFEKSRSAKRFDDIRDLLMFNTQTNVVLFGNGRGYEHLIIRLLGHELGEARYWGREIFEGLSTTIPSFIQRIATPRGAEVQIYRRNIKNLGKEESIKQIVDWTYDKKEGSPIAKKFNSVELVSYTPDADIEILTAFGLKNSVGTGFNELREIIASWPKEKRDQKLKEILLERNLNKQSPTQAEVRFRKVPRAFEVAHFTFMVTARGGDYRDLQRHRMQTQGRQLFNTSRGFELEQDVMESPFYNSVHRALHRPFASKELVELSKLMPEVYQYAVPFTYLQHWYMHLSAREIYYLIELRTSKQARSCYKKIAQEIARQAIETYPSIFGGIYVDWEIEGLARRESEKKISKKLKKLNE